MRILRHYRGVDDAAAGAVVALGNFDGVHRGHQAVIGTAGAIARRDGAPHAVMTFEPHPRRVFQPDAPPFRLTTFRGKARIIETLGADLLFALRFDWVFAQRPAEEFVETVLLEGIRARHVVVGHDFVFGKGRRGDAELLRAMAGRHGFDLTVVPKVDGPGGESCSSTHIREYLQAGRVRDAARLLDRPWEIEGRVIPGDRRGRQLGFPTANLELDGYLRPAFGVYAVRAGLDRPGASDGGTVWYNGVANLGTRPTVDGRRLLLEVNVFDFSEDIYRRWLRVALVEHLRPEKTFDGLEQLTAQIADDSRRARALLEADDAAAYPSTHYQD